MSVMIFLAIGASVLVGIGTAHCQPAEQIQVDEVVVTTDNLVFTLEIVSVVFAIAYLAFAIRQSLWCWPAALISTALWAIVVFDAQLYMDSALQVFYFAMGIYGWIQWQRGGQDGAGVRVHWWRLSTHLIVVSAVLVISAASAWLLRTTDAAFPFVDSLTTVAAVVTTFMVARKVMENWIYWFVIDGIYIFLYVERGLLAYAGLYLLYLVMVIFGFMAWLRDSSQRLSPDVNATA